MLDVDQPSVSTDGGITNPQYGYFYNWCAGMGFYRSATQFSDTGVRGLSFTGSDVYPLGNLGKTAGFSLRCVVA